VTVAVAVLAVVVAVLSVLVAGLLRSHATILRRLHEAGIDLDPSAPATTLPMASGAPATTAATEVDESLRTPRPNDAPAGRRAADVSGRTPDGGSVGVAVCDVDHDTVLLFLSSDCATCQRFWGVLAADAVERPALPDGVRLVVVTRGPEHESPAAVVAHGADVPVVMSDDAWRDLDVPGSPYAIHVDGPSGRVRGEGTGGDWGQVAQLLARATGDLAYVGETRPRARKAHRDAVAEQDTDAALLAAGILPGDDSLYRRADGSWAGAPDGRA
jgi:hypothetical protein